MAGPEDDRIYLGEVAQTFVGPEVDRTYAGEVAQIMRKRENKKKILASPGFEPETFSVLD